MVRIQVELGLRSELEELDSKASASVTALESMQKSPELAEHRCIREMHFEEMQVDFARNVTTAGRLPSWNATCITAPVLQKNVTKLKEKSAIPLHAAFLTFCQPMITSCLEKLLCKISALLL